MRDIDQAKKAAKAAGAKGFRRLKLKRPLWTIGKQGVRLEKAKGAELLEALEAQGFGFSGGRQLLDDLNGSGLLDTITIY